MARELDQDELIERWTLIGDDLARVASRRSAAKRVRSRANSSWLIGRFSTAVISFGGVGAPGR